LGQVEGGGNAKRKRMKTRKFFLGLWLLVALLALGACSDLTTPLVEPDDEALLSDLAARGPVDPMSKVNRLPAALEQRVRALRADLEGSGYQVARGYWTLWDVDDCKYSLRTVGFCYGQNPTAPYVLAVVPRWRDEFFDRRSQHMLIAPQRNMAPTYRLDEREALVVVAEMPPPARYFGIQTNVFTRLATLNEADPIYRQVQDPLLRDILFATSPDPARRMLFSSIGNSINNVVIEEQTGQPWQAGQQRYFVITPDESLAEEITEALRRAGVEANHVFTEPVAPALVKLGLGAGADDLITAVRYALPDDEVLGQQWRERLPLTILRVRDTSGSTLEPFAIPDYEGRTSNYDEHALEADLKALIAAVKDYWNQPDATEGLFFSAFRRLDLVGQHCLGYPVTDPLRGPMNCLGDTQDADYQINIESLRLDPDTVIAVMGTLATETDNATYVSVSINWFPELVAVKNLSDIDLRGTAAPFADALGDNAGLFYVHYLARDCSGLDPCVEIPTKLVPRGGLIKVIQRNYVVPGSRRGPDPYKLLNPVALVFDGSNRP
jgi:hypothetical protein